MKRKITGNIEQMKELAYLWWFMCVCEGERQEDEEEHGNKLQINKFIQR